MLRSIKRVDAGSNLETYVYSPLVSGNHAKPKIGILSYMVGHSMNYTDARPYSVRILGLLVFAIAHWLCDLFWYYFLSSLSFKGTQFFGNGLQKIILQHLGLLSSYFE